VGSLDGRARRLEEQAEWQETADCLEKERTFREAISRLSTSELQAMSEYMASTDRDEWAEEDKPFMLRLLELMEEVRREGAGARGETVDPPWLSEIKGKE
jgi:cobalamin biosynthesis Mg chelatase CobN